MAYLFRKSSAPFGMTFDANRDPASEDWNPVLTNRRDSPIEPWMREFYPDTLFVDDQDTRLLHWGMGLGGMYCVSQRVKDLIEKMDPEVHQFLDVDLRYGSSVYPYFILKFGHSIDCVDVANSEVEWNENHIRERVIKWWIPLPGKPLLIKRDAVAKAHLWQTDGPQDLKFMSDDLHDMLEAHEALTGLKCERQKDA